LRIVLDTNVLVSGLLSPFGPPGEIVRLVSSGLMSLCLDARIVAEYHDVLARPRFGFDDEAVADLLAYLESSGEMVASAPLAMRLPDLDDEPFLEVALAGAADCLVTGNLSHFPPAARAGVAVLSPAELIDRYRKSLVDFETATAEGEE
jgi:putative PIN family toxin of toxin-antitoxin system